MLRPSIKITHCDNITHYVIQCVILVSKVTHLSNSLLNLLVEMPALCPVPTLKKCAISVLTNLILERLEDQDENASTGIWANNVQKYCLEHIRNISAYEELREMLLIKLDALFVNTPVKRPKLRYFVPKLTGSQIKVLDFSKYQVIADKMITKTIYLTMEKTCPNIECLKLGRSFIFQPDLVKDLNCRLGSFKNLISLHVNYVATPDTLYELGELCPKLKDLNVKGSGEVGNESVKHISACKNLGVLDIQGTKISGLGSFSIIESCPKLEWLEHCPFNCDSDFQIFKSREEIFNLIKQGYKDRSENVNQNRTENEKENNQFQVNIKNFWLSNPTQEELMVSFMLPKLEKLRLDFIFQDMNFWLEASPISRFEHINTLDLNFYDNHDESLFIRIINACGMRITKLIFNVFAEYRNIVNCHNVIAQKCPNLKSLTFVGDYRSAQNQDETDQDIDNLLLTPTLDFQPHSNLEELTLGGYCTDGRLSWILGSASKIRNIVLDGNLERLSSSSWLAILSENCLEQLETVWFNTSTDMNMNVVERLIATCPKLKRVGRLINLKEHVGGARRGDYLHLLQRARDANWDIDFVWVSPNRKKFQLYNLFDV